MAHIPPDSRDDFEIVILCALPKEANAAQKVFSKVWTVQDKDYGQTVGDNNSYTMGMIGLHNVVLAHMPGMGKVNASTVAKDVEKSFNNIKLAVVLGICGGVPVTQNGKFVYLGDLVISTEVIQYDFGKQYPGQFRRKKTISDEMRKPPPSIATKIASLQTDLGKQQMLTGLKIHLRTLLSVLPAAKYPGITNDILYKTSYLHKHHGDAKELTCECSAAKIQSCLEATDKTCEELGCDRKKATQRKHHSAEGSPHDDQHLPTINFGRYGSADTVMKSAAHRDDLVKTNNIIAFEMEGSGVWNTFPCLVIKAVADYCDSHKNDMWHEYAAAVAAAGLKAFLDQWRPLNKAKSPSERSAENVENVYFGGINIAGHNMTNIGHVRGDLNMT